MDRPHPTPPASAEAHFQRAIALHKAGKLVEAVAAYHQAIALRGDYLDAHFMLGNALAARGEIAEAMACFRRVLRINPNHLDALANLGTAFLHLGQADEAVPIYQEVLSIDPGYFLARNNLAAALNALGKHEEAERAARRAIEMRADYSLAHRNLGEALGGRGNWAEAAECFRKANALEPAPVGRNASAAECRVKLGIALKHLGRIDEALANFRTAAELMPGNLEPSRFLAAVFADLGYMDESLAMALEIVRNHPASARAYNSLGSALMERRDLSGAIGAFSKSVSLDPSYALARSNKIFACMFDPTYSSVQLLEEARQWDACHAPRNINPQFANSPSLDRKLRVGYVSSAFCDHVIGKNILPLLRDRDRERFEVVCYSDAQSRDGMNKRFRGLADGWRDTSGAADAAIAGQIRDDRIDILVDLSMHTSGNRLAVFALRPAPVQITFGAYPGTTGLSAIDYRLTDPHLDPPGKHDEEYSEKSVRLPNSYWCYDPDAMDVADLPEPGALPAIANGYVTFGCLNNFRKVSDGSLQLWAKMMLGVRGSRLVVLSPFGSHRDDLINFMSRHGIAPDRIGFVNRSAHAQYFKNYEAIDIALDTLAYNGHTTSLDAMWSGVPVVTLVGRTIAGRAGFSQAQNLGLGELVALGADQFVDIATGLAGDLSRLSRLRRTLRERMRVSPLCDAARWTRGVEEAIVLAWRGWCGSR